MNSRWVAVWGLLGSVSTLFGMTLPKPDITVAVDGSGNFKTIQAAVASIPKYSHERKVIFVKDGVYREKVRVDPSFVTIRGQSRAGTRIEFAQAEDDFTNHPDALGAAVLNLNGNDCVVENLTARNTLDAQGRHAFTVFGKGDRTVLLDDDLLSEGADTVAMWPNKTNRCYHAGCHFRGASDFVCPRGWCYATRCSFFAVKTTAATWHDGSKDKEMKFVLRDCTFDGAEPFFLGRHHLDAQFYFLDCSFAKTMSNRPIFRVTYPDNPKRTAELDKSNLWGERAYYYHCHREGGDYAWFSDNLASAPGNPAPGQITAAWTFGGKWDPEQTEGPGIEKVNLANALVALVFSEPVTVKGKPRLALSNGSFAEYASGSGLHTIQFRPSAEGAGEVKAVDLDGGAIIASQAGTTLRTANLELPRK